MDSGLNHSTKSELSDSPDEIGQEPFHQTNSFPQSVYFPLLAFLSSLCLNPPLTAFILKLQLTGNQLDSDEDQALASQSFVI